METKFYQKTWFMWLSLVFFAPLGIFLMWRYSKMGKILKIILSIIFAVIFVAALAPKADSNAPAANPSSSSAVESSANSAAESSAAPSQSEAAPAIAPASSEAPKATAYKEGMYKIGTDMDAGEYLLSTSGSGYFQVAKDSTGAFDSIVCNGNFDGTSYVTVSDGQYLTLTRCAAVSATDAPKADTSSGTLSDGMYKVGFDLPAGEYKITSAQGGYTQVSTDSTHDFGSIVTNDNFTGDKYITVSDGQYLTLTRCTLMLK